MVEIIIFGYLGFDGRLWCSSDTMGAGFYFLLMEVFPLTDKPAPTKRFTVFIFGACVFIY
jgi:hypothetical protein